MSDSKYQKITKQLAGILLVLSLLTFITTTAMLSPIGDQVQEWLNHLGIHMNYLPVTILTLLVVVYIISTAVILRTLSYLLDVDPGSL